MPVAKTLYAKKFSAQAIDIEVLPDALWSAPDAYEAEVMNTWNQKVSAAEQANVKIWDGMYYRVTNVADLDSQKKILLRLGTIPYRHIASADDLQESFAKYHLQPLNHLSTAAIIRTSDNLYVFGKRSLNGKIDLIGGGVQPDEIEVRSGVDLEKNLLKEVREEAGIEACHIASVQGLGIVQSVTTNVVLISHIQLKLSLAETQEQFKNREDEEMSDLLFVPERNIRPYLTTMSSYRSLIADFL